MHPFPRSLGDHVAAWIEAECCHGPGDVYGEAVRLTNEEHAFLESAYAIDPATGRREVDIAVYSRRKGTRKSELGAWLVAAEARGPVRAYMDAGEPVARPPVDPWIICAATTEDQSDLVYGAFRAIVKASPRLSPHFDVGLEVTYLVGAPGKIELTQSTNAAALDGARPTFQVGDEGHLWIDPRLHETFRTLRRNLRKRKAAQPWIFLPTTAYGKKQDSIAELLHKAAGSQVGRRRVGRLLFDHWQARGHWDLSDPMQLRLAIEEAGRDAHWSDTESIAAEWGDETSTDAERRRYWLNQPSEEAADSWLADHPGAWMACESALELAPGQDVTVAVDMSLRHDRTAVAIAGRVEGRMVLRAKVWHAVGGRVDVLEVMDFIRSLHNLYRVTAVGYDPRYFELPAAQLADDGIAMLEIPQSPERMVPICGHFYELIVGREVAHDGDAEFADHVNAAIRREGERGWTLSKGKSKAPIDACIAAAMACWLSDVPAETLKESEPWFAFG